LYTPWHFLVSGSYIFPGRLTEGNMGFITADIEYQTNTSSKFSFQPDANGNTPDNSYYDPLNNAVRSYYKNTFNFRLGGEYKVDELAYRIGGSYSMDPYSSPQLKANLTTISGGIGYRKHGIFIDITYVEVISNNVSFPYRLSGKDNVYSTVKNYAGNILLTFGIKI
jgi:long-subunit fatty acid transport protein